MPTQINNSEVTCDPYADPYADDPYSDYYGEDYLYEDEMSVVDPYADEYSAAEYESSEPLSVDSERDYVSQLEEMMLVTELSDTGKETVEGQIDELKNKLNVIVSMSEEVQAKELAIIHAELADLETQILSGEETGIGDGTMQSQIDETRAKADEYLSGGLIGQTAYDDVIKDLEEAQAFLDIEGESESGSANIQKLIDSAQEGLVSGSTTSDGAQKLSDLTGKDASKLMEIAEEHGLDLEDLPNPPTQEVIEFLMEASPDLAGQFQAVEDAVTAREAEIEKIEEKCNEQNAANTACTSDNDNMDMSNFQNLYDLKYHQDSKSKDVMNAMQEANGSLVELLKSVYPDVDGIQLETTSVAGGWEALNANYLSADKISFGGQTLDIFNSTNGKLRVSESADSECEVDGITIQYDWEGSGDWEDHGGKPSVDTYGDGIDLNIYDEG